jgi:hypothetical protein
MTRRQDASRNREVNRVNRRSKHVDRVSGRRGNVREFGEPADLTNDRCPHAAALNGGQLLITADLTVRVAPDEPHGFRCIARPAPGA